MKINFYKRIDNFKRFVLEKKKRFIVSGALVLTGALAINSVVENRTKDSIIKENEYGYEDINTTFNDFKNVFGMGVKENEFVVLNIGDSKKIGTYNQNKKIRYCNAHDIALGIVVTPTSILANDIYDDVELVRGIINEYDINFPVYLNIDGIIENNDIDNDIKIRIIKMFMDKCTANGIYVSIYGTDTNLVYLNKYCKITEFDAFVVMDKEKIEYPGSYNTYKDLDGKIISKCNLEEIIENTNSNDKNRLKNDGLYTIQEGDLLLEIAMKYNLSVNALLKYNDIKVEDFLPGLTIKVPSIIENVMPVNDKNTSYELLDKPIRGADFSHYQDENKMDWNKIKENFEFVILKCSEGTTLVDDDFEEFSTKCSNYNIPYGAYCLNAYRGNNFKSDEDFMKAQNSQIDTCLKTIANKNIEYPIYFDIEENEDMLKRNFTTDQITAMLDNWCERIQNSGYTPGLYCNRSAFNYISSFYDINKLENWVAQYKYNKTKITLDDTPIPKYTDGISMYQTSKTTVNVGAPVEVHEFTDIDYSFIDYSKQFTSNDNIEIKEIKRSYDIPYNCIAISSIGVVGITCLAIKKRNTKRIRRREM